MSEVRNTIIIGSGPAGLTAAIYTSRANLKPLMLEGEFVANGDQPGGQLMTTTDVENFPGFPTGIQGPELMANMRQQALHVGTEIVPKRVEKVDFSVRPFKVWTNTDEYQAKTIIISTGAKALMLGLESEERLVGRGVSTCATCDGFFFKGKDVAVVGGGDAALEEAIYLAKMAKSVTLIHRRDELRASQIMQDRARGCDNVTFQWNSEVVEILGESKVTGVRLASTVGGKGSELALDGVFIAIGHRPNTDLFKGHIELDAKGYIVTDGTRTSVPGVFAAGDVQDYVYRQAVTSAGSGCMAAIDAERSLHVHNEESKGHHKLVTKA